MNHESVLAKEVQNCLNLRKGDAVVDATLGLGGHSLEILEAIGKKGHLYAFELDEENLKEAKKRLAAYTSRITYINDNFRYLKTRVIGKKIDAVLFDLGLSSPHVDDPKRGFSFLKEGPLDMRFGPEGKITAEEVVNNYPEKQLAEIFWKYGEERFSRQIAKRIADQRKILRITTTTELAEIVKRSYPLKLIHKMQHHPATKVFQALRIEINDELNALQEALKQSYEILEVGGRLAVISYHSLEDRIVKQFLRELEKPTAQGQEAIYSVSGEPLIQILTKKPITPSQEELEKNPRSRSAKLRAAIKIK